VTKEREQTVSGVILATKVLKLKLSMETMAQAVVRLGYEYEIKLEEVEEVLEKESKREAKKAA
jgi:hypothetical protein